MAYPYLSDFLKAITGYDIPLPLPMFGICVAFAMLVATAQFQRELGRLYKNGQIGPAMMKSRGSDGLVTLRPVAPQEIVPGFTVAIMVAGIMGSRIFHIFEHIDEFTADPLSMIFTRAGLTIFGGLILGTIVGLLYVKWHKLPLRPLMDAAAPAMMLGYALGRIGCQVSGDGDWGVASNIALKPDFLPTWMWAQTYENNIIGEVIAAPGVYPAPMYETVMGLACFALLWVLRDHRFRKGWLFSLYVLLAGVERMVIEQVRINPMFDIGFATATQAEIISGLLILSGAVGLVLLARPAHARGVAGSLLEPVKSNG
ncbi:phosphatidylglycerol:prolipoprotein diacylglycerol transferase [Massilia aurea]|jgi:phosphatidylglycerol:prolipoprotein diacylglycerol transferase|uniref:Phosphatidylglycerol:prolipoprotein diacylglycerol transferase n=1 Tax=Massilia aurea TaxID=373040 RepID=A0A7W9WYN8_9BURK|nr:prolipoprotein diacylglyceryl transferase family protein [Massilia aurea]MBB6133217.1 phosphatidylglycerol:prolipoprotein diacylglycerol transferase [Massilia aurea]